MSLNPRFVLGDLDLTSYPFAIEWGSDLGNPENAAQVIDSLLQDGEIIASDRTSNRTITLPLLIEGGDLIVLAEAEAALQAETDKQQNVLLVDPGDGLAVPTLFDTFRTQVRFSRDDDEEIAGFRRYVLTLPALPFGRSATEVTDAGLVSAAVPSTVVIQDGSSTTNWTSSPGTVTSSSGFLTQSSAPATVHSGSHMFTVNHRYTYTPGSAVDMSATTYLSVDYRPIVLGPSNDNRVTAYADGLLLPQVAEVALVSPSGWRRVTFLCPDASVAAVRFDVWSRQIFPADGTGGPSISTLSTAIDNVQRTNQAPSLSTTGRESVRSFTVSGSARTQGRLAVAHATAGLGDVILHTSPLLAAGTSPDLRRYRTSGGTVTADSATVSGTREASNAAVTFNVPAILLPAGGYVLYARMRSTTGSPVTVTPTWTAATKIGSTTFAPQSGTAASVTLLNAGAWSLVPIGGMVLPTMDVPASTAATVEITFTGGTSTEYDEAFLFYAGDDSALTIVSCGTGTPAAGTVHNRLWVDTPTLDHPRPAIWVGTQADRSDAFHAGTLAPLSWQVPSFAPGEMNIFLATTGVANATVDLAHFPRWLQHAGIVS